MENNPVSEIDILEWISLLSDENNREEAKAMLRNAGVAALPWLVCSHSGANGSRGEVAELIREIVGRNGIPRKGGRIIRKIISSA